MTPTSQEASAALIVLAHTAPHVWADQLADRLGALGCSLTYRRAVRDDVLARAVETTRG